MKNTYGCQGCRDFKNGRCFWDEEWSECLPAKECESYEINIKENAA